MCSDNVVFIVRDTLESAKESKKYFGQEYDLYCSYCLQFVNSVEGKKVKYMPVSKQDYDQL